MGADPVRRRQGRADPGHHQPGLPPRRARIHAEQGRREGAGHRAGVQDQRLRRHDGDAGAGAAAARAGQLGAARLPALQRGDQDRRRAHGPAGCASTRSRPSAATPSARGSPRSAPRCSRRRRSTSSSPAAPPACPRARRSPTATSSTTAIFVGEAMRLTRAATGICIPVPLYHCFGMVMGNLGCVTPRRGDGLSRRGLRAAGDAGGGRGRALHRALRRADHVHRRARPSRLRALRPVVPAHRHHGRLALPGRGDEAGDRATCTCARSPSPTA